MDKYCLCESISIFNHNEHSIKQIEDSLSSKHTEEPIVIDEEPPVKPALQRRRKNPIPDITEAISKVYSKLQNNSDFTIYPRNKGNRGLHNGQSKRRSIYVGVSKNGVHWQTLINFGKIKKYIGTFCTEKEAALTYDFYAFGVHGLKAKTNFKHNGKEIMAMIESFFSNGNKFIPAHFVVNV